MKEKLVTSVTEYVSYIESLNQLKDLWFRGVSSPKYLPVPGLVWQNLRDSESTLEHGFLVSYKSYTDQKDLNSWEVFALMQHHGLPTRLLDWSESALVALYFALTSEPESDDYRAVWVLDPYELNTNTIGTPALYCPAAIKGTEQKKITELISAESYLPPNLRTDNTVESAEKPIAINTTQHIRRVSSQKGCFTVHGTSDNSINTYLENPDHFHMIKIDARSPGKRNTMLETLSGLGIDEEYIYQDLDSLCRNIMRKL